MSMDFEDTPQNSLQDADQQDSNGTGGGGASSIGGTGGGSIGTMGNRDRDRDRRGRGDRGTRFSDADNNTNNSGRDRSRERRNCRIYVSNIPYDYRWQDLKDLFRRIVGSVEYVELFSDESGKARGCGIVEFKDPDNVEKAMEKMNRYEINGREIVVKEDHGENRDQYGRILRDGGMGEGGGGGGGGRGGGGGGGGGGMGSLGLSGLMGGGGGGGGRDRDRGFSRRDRDDDRIAGGRHMGMGGGGGGGGGNGLGMHTQNDFDMPYNTYGLSTSFLESLGINGPLHTKIFVANLDYKVDSKKLKQVFKLAGKVQSVDLSVDKEGNSRGFAVIEYDHPVEAVQSISMFDRQMLYERRMTVRLDRVPDKTESLKLPDGLGGIGIGLGPNGEPLRDVARNLPNMTQNQQSSSGGMGGNLSQNSVPVPVAPPINNASANLLGAVANTPASVLSGLSNTNLAALSNVVGGLKNLAGVGAALTNPLLTSSLSNLGLNLGGGSSASGGGGGDGNDSSSATPVPNNYSTGNSYNSGYTSTTFNTGVGRSDFDPSVRNYNTQPQDNSGDFGNGGGGVGSGGNSGLGGNGNNLATLANLANLGGVGVGNMFSNSPMGGVGSGGGGGMSGGRKSDTIIIKNIPLSCTWQTLRDKFRDVGEVKFAEIRGNDVGVVRFFKEKDAEVAIKLMDGSRMDGRTVTVNFF